MPNISWWTPHFFPDIKYVFYPPPLLKPHDKIPWFFLSLCIKLQQQNVFCFFFRPRGGFFAPCVGNIIKASGKLYGKKFFGQRERESSDIYLLRYSARNFFLGGILWTKVFFCHLKGGNCDIVSEGQREGQTSVSRITTTVRKQLEKKRVCYKRRERRGWRKLNKKQMP